MVSEARALDLEIPQVAKDPLTLSQIEIETKTQQTRHSLFVGDSRSMREVLDGSVHLVLTSPPYWTLKEYNKSPGQLGHVEDYASFLNELDRVWAECHRVLVPGGRLVVVVGDVCLSRRENGRHEVVPLHSDIQVRCRELGFENLAPIIWYKIANAKFEAEGNSGGYLGKPFEPNGIVKNDIEFILMLRKPGGYRKPSLQQRRLSVISERNFRKWFVQVWDLRGESTRNHPAPFPLELAERLVRMFSFVDDTVLDPFAGTGTTMAASAMWGRNSIGYEVDPSYAEYAKKRFEGSAASLLGKRTLRVRKALAESS